VPRAYDARRTQTVDGFGTGGIARRPVQTGSMARSPQPMFPVAAPVAAPAQQLVQNPQTVSKPAPLQLDQKPAQAAKPLSRLAPPSKHIQPLPRAVVDAAMMPGAPLPAKIASIDVRDAPADMQADDPGAEPIHRVAPLDLSLDDSPAADRPKNRLQAGKAFRKWMLRGGLAAAVLLLAVGGLLFYQGLNKVHKVFKGTASRAAALQSEVNPTLLKGEGDGRVNILLLGNGGVGHDGPDLTDTMMVASIDPINKTATLLSVPRDLWVKMPNNFISANQKINAAYESGKYHYLGKQDASNADSKAVEAGFTAADQTVSQVLGITIHYNMVVDFHAFRQAVDSVGGVTINVPEQLYDPTMAWENNHNPILAAAGVQQMDGIHALMYARSRETTSDFARGERQRAIILALKEKALSLGTLSNPVKISSLMSAFGNNLVTDLSLSDAVRLYDLTKGISGDNIKSLDLVTKPNMLVTTGNMNGISIDQPRAGLYNYGEIQAFVRASLRDGYITKENSSVTVLNGTSVAGLATTKANELKSFGYNVAKVDNAPTEAYDQTVVVDLTNGADKYTKHYLENRYGVSAVTKIPDTSIQAGDAHFIVILGQDQVR
jgi:LCP family protein required for cell wall assembly